ncbi:MAG TPA: OmpA family protein [Moraxellaceae bacterium]|nr:OmpA family protein [Moraxellaceae bacterium]
MKFRMTIVCMAVLVGGCSLTPVASRVPGYLTTPKGSLLRDADGRCWRTADWRPALAIPECDPEVVQAQQEAVATVEKDKEADKEGDKKNADEAPADADGGDAVAAGDEGAGNADAVDVPEAVTANAAPAAAGEREHAAAVAAAVLADSLGTAPAGQVLPRKPRFRDEVVFEPVVLNSDATFYFGDDHLTAEGQAAVAEIAGVLLARHASDLRITVTGHTDRIGSAGANRSLSGRRAQAVKTALVAAGLPAAAIDVVGLGATKPVTVPDQCPNRLVKCELIACLRPDRRVEIQARGRLPSGTRQVPVEGQHVPAPRSNIADEPRVCRAG